jgi:hypothetical protein
LLKFKQRNERQKRLKCRKRSSCGGGRRSRLGSMVTPDQQAREALGVEGPEEGVVVG